MKIVLLPGVRIYKIEARHQEFLNSITDQLDCDGEIFTWEPGYIHPEYDLPFKSFRDFTYEVILDFQEAITKATEIVVPNGDIYIGHSAGSIIALIQQKPTITMASPAPLINLVKRERSNKRANEVADLMLRDPTIPILNVINRYDLLACPLDKPNVENYEYGSPWYHVSGYFPLTAHSDYWSNKRVINKIVETVKKWAKKNIEK